MGVPLQWSSLWRQPCREIEPRAPAAPEKCIHLSKSWSTDARKQAEQKEWKERRGTWGAWNEDQGVSGGSEVCDRSRYWGRMGWKILQWGKEKLSLCQSTDKIRVLKLFYVQVDITCTGQVEWQQLCSYLLLEYTERERASIPRAALLDSQPLIRHCSHNKVGPTWLATPGQIRRKGLGRMLNGQNHYSEMLIGVTKKKRKGGEDKQRAHCNLAHKYTKGQQMVASN